jgi:plasmid stability protein
MPDLLVKDLDDATFRTIAFQAEAMNRSVEDVVRELIRIGLLHDVEGRVAVADKIRSTSRPPPPGTVVEDSTEIIRALRGRI